MAQTNVDSHSMDLSDWCTAEEARQRWCPFSRVRRHGSEAPAQNRLFDGTVLAEVGERTGTGCLGPACMAWRFIARFPGEQGAPRGYCGLVPITS